MVIPCHNEAESVPNLREAIDRLRSALANQCELEMILVDDGSIDATNRLLREAFRQQPDVTLLRNATNQGIAAAIALGLRHARADIVASLDADCTYDPLQLVNMLQLLDDDVDLVVASPHHPLGGVEGIPGWRRVLSRMASYSYRLLLRNKLYTYTSCVRLYRCASVINLPLHYGGFVGITELVWQLDRREGKIVEYPTVLNSRKFGHSKMRTVRTVFAHLGLLIRVIIARVLHSLSERCVRPH